MAVRALEQVSWKNRRWWYKSAMTVKRNASGSTLSGDDKIQVEIMRSMVKTEKKRSLEL